MVVINTTYNSGKLPIREEALEGTTLRIGYVQMKDFKLYAYNASRYVLAGNVLVVLDSNGKKTALYTAATFERLKEHNVLADVA